ncbi:hypothetical protein BT93_F2250 [Corymbia citriodora subsp. variegata]|nr:hypothetical protein BT93_F2250 [Corymbia citriodora subsp. variegata]
MGGIGKTTLAKVVFNQISSQFHGCSFLSDIREFARHGKMEKLQKRLLSDILKSKAVKINDIDTGINMIREKFRCRKVLVVLDNVDKRDQLVKLAEKREWFGPGSRIIVTTRDISFFQNNPQEFQLYEMEEMPFHYAIQLFSKHAFRRDAPPCDYDRIAREIVKTTGGLPLALVVIGSSLYCRGEEVWDDALEKLEKMPHKEVQDMLKISYDMLEYEQREIFLDIACHMAGEDRNDAVCMWKTCEFFPNSAITALVEMSLIKITNDQKIWMHDQLRDLGREIVRRESIQHPEKRSRLWCPTVAMGVMRRNEGTENIVALKLGGDSKPHDITREELLRLVKLRFLELDGGSFMGDFQDLLSEMRWLSWHHCPSEFQAANFSPSNLVVLKISGSDITNDWGGWSQIMGKSRLKVLNLRCCRSLIKTPDFSTCLTLERLILKDCESLVEIDPSIGMLQNLKHLEINGCNGLRMLEKASNEQNPCLIPQFLPNSLGNLKFLSTLRMENMELLELPESIGDLTGLQCLSLSHSSVIDLPSSIGKLRSLVELTLSHTKVTELPNSIGELKRLQVLLMPGCKLRKLPKAIGMLEKLRELVAYDCELLDGEVPSEIGALSSLRILDLGGTRICKLPTSIKRLHQLESLHLFPCHELPKLPELPANLNTLKFKSSTLQTIPNVSNLTNLVALSLSDYGRPKFVAPSKEFGPHHEPEANQTPDLRWIGRLRKLRRLKIELSDVTTLPAEVNSLTGLQRLDVPWSTFQSHAHYPSNLQRLNLIGFESTGEWSRDYDLKKLSSFELCRSSLTDIPLNRLGQFENLTELHVTDCRLLETLSNISSLRKLQRLWITNCPRLVEIRGLGQLESLEDLCIHGCVSLRELQDLSHLRNLMMLGFSGCKSLVNLPPVANKDACRVNIHSCRMLRDFDGPYQLY